MDEPILIVYPSRDYMEKVLQDAPCSVALVDRSRQEALSGLPCMVADLSDVSDCLSKIRHYASESELSFRGIATYVCEHMGLTAQLAKNLGLWFYTPEQVQNTRYKSRTKAMWDASGIPTPPGCVGRR